MIKNLNETLSLLTLIILVISALKIGIGWMFSFDQSDTFKSNLVLFKNYEENEDE